MNKLAKAFGRGFLKEAREVETPPEKDHGGTQVQEAQEAEPGDYDREDFDPDLTPREMLERGIFGGTYFREKPEDLPNEWFKNVDFEDVKQKAERNYYERNASKPMKYWEDKGWINEDADPKGWFQWYGRYHQGRRLPEEDKRQIRRWKQFKRHKAQVEKNCDPEDEDCRRKQKQALLHWGYDPKELVYE